MATSTRLQIIGRVVTTLAAVTVAGGYYTDLDGPRVVAASQESMQARRQLNLPVVVRVRDGVETIKRTSQNHDLEATIEVIIEVFVAATNVDLSILDKTNQVIADVRLALDRDTRLGGLVFDNFVTAVGESEYDFDSRVATVNLIATARYDIVQGTSI